MLGMEIRGSEILRGAGPNVPRLDFQWMRRVEEGTGLTSMEVPEEIPFL